MKIYIAGKVTGDPNYREKFAKAKRLIEAQGGNTVLVPSVLPAGMTDAEYMHICLAMIDTVDMVAFLPDWFESEGAQLERQYCEYIKKPYTEVGFFG